MIIRAKYAGVCKRCKLGFEAGQDIEWSRAEGAKHATLAGCEGARRAEAYAAERRESAPKLAQARPAVRLDSLAKFMLGASARGLRAPKARFAAPGGGELVVYVASVRSKVPGAVNVLTRDSAGAESWLGRVTAAGEVQGVKLLGAPEVLSALEAVERDPARAAAEYGALEGRCSFCGLALTDQGSVEVGYGPVCAEKYGLPHTPRGSRIAAVSSPELDGTGLAATERSA